MKKIYKYPLAITDRQVITLPLEAEILTVQVQNNTPCIWAMVDTTYTETSDIIVHIVGTGNEIPKEAVEGYFGTVQTDGGGLVWHVFFDFDMRN